MKVGYDWLEALNAMEPDQRPCPIYRVRSWQRGAALYVAGNLLQFLSYAFAAQSLLLALSSTQFATQLLFAWLMEGVNVPWRSVTGAGIIISFNVLLVVFSSKASKLLKAEELLALYKEPIYIAYQVIGLGVCIVSGTAYGLTYMSSMKTRLPASAIHWRPVLLAISAAIPGTQALLMSKSLSMMVVVSLGQENQLGYWFFWVAAFVPPVAASIWTCTLTHALAMFPTVVALPVLQVVYTLVGILCGALYFQEWRDMSPLAIGMFCLGYVGMVGGIRVSLSSHDIAQGLQV